MRPRIVIIGAGISGLALGWALRQRFKDGIDLNILEKSPRAGGWISSQPVGSFCFEQGPRSCRSRGAGSATLQLIEALGLADEVITAAPAAQQRFIYDKGSLQPLPRNLWAFLRSPLMHGLPLALLKEWQRPAAEGGADESIAGFIGRRFSNEIAERLIDPLTSGIYAGNMHRLSMRACFPSLYCMEQQHGSLGKGFLMSMWKPDGKAATSSFVQSIQKSPLFTLRHGMQTLVTILANNLAPDLKLGCGVKTIDVQPAAINIYTDDDTKFTADQVFMAVPAQAAAGIIRPTHAALADEMALGKTASVAVVNMAWKNDVLNRQGFGYLIPSKEKEDLLGVVWDSSAFPQQNKTSPETRLTAMLGGTHHPELVLLPEAELIRRVRQGLRRHLAISAPPDAVQCTRAIQAIPQYEVGHLARLQGIEIALQSWSNARLKLIGSAWRGVSINDCIAEALAAAQA